MVSVLRLIINCYLINMVRINILLVMCVRNEFCVW